MVGLLKSEGAIAPEDEPETRMQGDQNAFVHLCSMVSRGFSMVSGFANSLGFHVFTPKGVVFTRGPPRDLF